MSLRSTVRRLLVALCATAAGGAALAAPQSAVAAPTPSLAAPAETSGSVVQGLTFPGDAGFAYAGCYGWDGGVAPQALVRDIPGSPNGNRSTGFTTSAGTGAGPQAAVPSLRNIGPMDISVWSEGGADGFAYVWLFPAKGGAFLGTTRLATGAGWATSDAASATFTWTERSRRTFAPVAGSTRGGSLSLAQAATRFGNGPARVGFAFGCDGGDFSLDRFRVGTSSFDFEGVSVLTSMTVGRRTPDGTTLVGRSAGAGKSTGEPLVLQASRRGNAFRDLTGAPVEVDADGVHTAVVKPAVTTKYRWRRVEVSYAAGGESNVVAVRGTKAVAERDGKQGRRLAPGGPDATEPPTEQPTEPEAEQPTEPTEPTEPAVPDPTEPPTEQPTEPETEQPTEPTEPAVPDPTEPPTQEPSPEPSPEPTPEAPVACEGLTYEDTAVWLEAQGLDASDITSTLDEDCPTAEDLDAMAAELGIVLELVPGIQG
ncbi:hypothetical protein [uncultured Nocardioides sp.]|uniref:hypothetical protein n=1 Tax=uncultured Nocardioides sp. TaxID=198441 RepID=UPI00260631EE|nr:hypothetical protein [uncultured Nocardioides sp.]